MVDSAKKQEEQKPQPQKFKAFENDNSPRSIEDPAVAQNNKEH